MTKSKALINAIIKSSHPIRGVLHDYDPLLEQIADSQIVLIGEASHGTYEFYQARADITKRLIEEKGFSTVAIEGDWPAAYCVNEFVTHTSSDDAEHALSEFTRFPSWMWRNTIVVDFITWLRSHNKNISQDTLPVSFFGLDLYSLHRSIQEVLAYLESVDPIAADKARKRYSCFDHFGEDPQAYGYWTVLEPHLSCKAPVIDQLLELRKHEVDYIQNLVTLQDFFNAEQNARLIKNAERYYRSIFRGDVNSWNVRDTHMMETVTSLEQHLKLQGQTGKIVIWAHNSHLGDARATEMTARGEINLGQLARQKYGEKAYSIGFTTYSGTVSAASQWGADVERKRVRPALTESYEELFHQTTLSHFLFFTNDHKLPEEWFKKERLERAIGVIYQPQTERLSHYFYALLPQQFDAIIHFDTTQAVTPLDVTSEWVAGEFPDTYPTGE